jgi:hypothetical protein
MSKIQVKPFCRGPEYRTTVWIATDVAESLKEYLAEDPDGIKYVNKVHYYAKGGFHNFEGDKESIRSKSAVAPGIFAIQLPGKLFRLYGFYETAQKKDFIILTTTFKKGQKMREKDRDEVKLAAAIRDSLNWERAAS